MSGNSKYFRAVIGSLLTCVILVAVDLGATPIRLTTTPKGTNQIEFTFSPVVPGVWYKILARTNDPEGHWMGFAGFEGPSNGVVTGSCNLGGPGELAGLKRETVQNWTFVAGRWDDPFGNELPPLYVELVLRGDPYVAGDPYGDPMGDGWSNLQKLQNNMDPLRVNRPPKPRISVQFSDMTPRQPLVIYTNQPPGKAVVTIDNFSGLLPEYIVIQKAIRRLRPPPTEMRPNQFVPGPRNSPYLTNRPPFNPKNRPGLMARTNGPSLRPPFYNRRQLTAEDMIETGPFQEVARIKTRPGVQTYTYVETNVDTLAQPLYRCLAEVPPPFSSSLTELNSNSIRRTLLPVQSRPTTNGYELAAYRPIPYGRYLLLVRDKSNPHWRASGYFIAGTNSNPILLRVDARGMMGDGQTPIAMPEVKFLHPVVEPQFTAGWGEDSDGDGLPDIYEVLVTGTDPVNADTGETGVLDGYKEMTNDGWSNLEKFRRRADPLRAATPPPTTELVQPTPIEIFNALTPTTDLYCEVDLAVRTNATAGFQPIEEAPWMLSKVLNFRQRDTRKDFDVRVSWHFAEPNYNQGSRAQFPRESSWGEAVAPLIHRVNLKLITAFKEHVESSPPVTWAEASNLVASVVQASHQGEMDQGLAMAEMMILAENTAQDFYGKVIDQRGRPVADATIIAKATRDGGGGATNTQTDAQGRFQILGLRGRSLNIAVQKSRFEIQGHGVGLRNANGPETSATNRAVFAMWKLKGPEPMIHDRKVYQFKADDRTCTIDLLAKEMTEGTNGSGDLLVHFRRPPQIQRGRDFEWSFEMSALGGGVIQVTNADYLNEAPVKGYQANFVVDMAPSNANWRSYSEAAFYLKSRNGQIFSHIHLKIYPESGDGSSLEVESYVNPSASRNLEFDPAMQIQNVPEKKAPASISPAPAPVSTRLFSTNRQGQIVSWGSMVLPFVKPKTRFVAVAAGGEHSLALTSDGRVIAWGRNLSGEATVPEGLNDVVAVAAGGRSNSGFSVALRRDGQVFAWGDNQIHHIAVPAGLSNVVAISAGTDHCLALKMDGTIEGWGFNEDGKAESPTGESNFVAIAAGGEHSVALKRDGTVIAWGRNQWGQTNVPPGLSNVVAICSGSCFGLALKQDGKIVAWGGTFNKEAAVPQDVTNVVAIAAGPWDAMALKKDGTLEMWGRDAFAATSVPVGLRNARNFSGGGSDYGGHCLAIIKDGTIVAWGNNNYGQSLAPGGMTDVVSIAAGQDHYLAIRSDGSVIGWGGQEHQGNGQAWAPSTLGPVAAVAGGIDHSIAIRTDGTLAAWGYDSSGLSALPGNLRSVRALATGPNHSLALQTNGNVIGWGLARYSSVPTSLSNVVAIAVGSRRSIALRHDGVVVAWDDNGAIEKTAVDGASNVVAIAAGSGDHEMALRSDGTVVAWGNNAAGQADVPGGLTKVATIAAGANHSLAARRDGTVIAWGANDSGQSTVPLGLSNVIAVAAGGTSSAAIVVQTPEPSADRWILYVVLCGICLATLLLVRHGRERVKSPAA
jgi:alpha-tubulin suppressor-like RCC1 family protein